ncbi:MAG: chromosome segregation protein [Chthonomonadaceae bacterium]|nr:chromosome segregation protein [Chthonomonadaceae bacterium]
MEKLRHVRIEGYRSIRQLDLELTDLTVLVGANGSGKSNFISFFQMLNFMLSGSLQVYIARRGGGSSILHYGPQQTSVLHAELNFEGADNVSKYGFNLAFAAPDTLLFAYEYVQFQNADRPVAYDRNLGSGHLETKLVRLSKEGSKEGGGSKVARTFMERLNEVQAYHFHDTSEDSSMRTSQDLARNRHLMSTGGNLAAFLYMLRETKPQHYARILSTVRLAVPYLSDFVLEPDRLNTGRIQLRWRDRNPDHEFGAHQLSDGSLRAIALITALLQPEEMMPGLIMIDEPELGLHPSAVGLIGSLIKAASLRRQVVVATQSPRLISEFEPEDIVVVEREEDTKGDGQSIFHRLSREELGDWLKEYSLGTLYEMQVTGGGPQ